MARKSGLGPLLIGMAVGAAAVFFSKKENRKKAQDLANKASSKAKKLRDDYKKNPDKVKKQLAAEGQKFANKALAEAKRTGAKIQKNATKASKK